MLTDQTHIGGSGWEGRSTPPNARRLGHVSARDHNALNCTPFAVLNLDRDSMAHYGFSAATRLFEAAACGVPIISDDWPGLDVFARECRILDRLGRWCDIGAKRRPRQQQHRLDR